MLRWSLSFLLFGIGFDIISSEQKVDADFILQRMINQSYDARLRPAALLDNGTLSFNEPTRVEVNMYMRSISNIDFVSMSYDVQVTFRETWRDHRLSYAHLAQKVPKFIIFTNTDQIWRPDTFFANEIRAHRHVIDMPNILLRVHSDGRVLFSERLTLTLACNMRLQDSMPSFFLSEINSTTCTSVTNTGIYSCLRTIFVFTRQFSYYVLQVYIPSTLLVIVSWVSFWLDRAAVPARVTLGVTTLLTMTTQAGSINSKLPPVSYIKACLIFIFGAVLQFAWVSYMASHLEAKLKKKDDLDTNMSEHKNLLDQDETTKKIGKSKKFWFQNMFEGADEAKRIDIQARIVFPIAFLVFNIVYWIYYF